MSHPLYRTPVSRPSRIISARVLDHADHVRQALAIAKKGTELSATLHVMYPTGEGLTFDHDYYAGHHMKLVRDGLGDVAESMSASRGIAGGPDIPPGYFAVFTLTVASLDVLQGALANSQAILDDIPNYYNGRPTILIGETIQ